MAIQTVPIVPNNSYTNPRNTFQEWGVVISAAIQNAGLAKTQLPGFGIYPRVSKSFQQPSTGGTSPSFVIPAGIFTADYMLVSVTVVSGVTITTPSGWTLIRSDTATGGTGPVTQSLYSRFAVGTTGQLSTDCGTTVTFTLSATTGAAFASFVAYVGVSTINVQGVASSTANGTTATAGALTTTVANARVIQCIGLDTTTVTTSSATSSTPTGYIAQVAQVGQTSGTVSGAIYDLVQNVAGTTGTPTSTLTNTGSWVVQTIALTPNTALFVPTLSQTNTGGTLAAATYAYRVSATNAQGETVPCPEVTIVVPTGSGNTVTVTWAAVVNATGYKVYGRTSGSELLLQTITSGTTLSWTDTGALTPAGALNTVDTTSDTGQLAWGAAVVPTATSTKYGYEIWQFTDSFQATSPVFLRIDYGSAPAVLMPGMWVTVGTATNGAGTITANANLPNSFTASNVIHSNSTNGNSTTASNVYVDSDSGGSLMIVGPVMASAAGTPQDSGFVGAFERTREWDGTFNGEGVACTWGVPSTNPAACIVGCLVIANAAQFSQPTTTNGFPALAPSGFTPTFFATIGNTVYFYPYGASWTPKLNAPGKHFVQCFAGDIAQGVTVSLTSYGVSHNFIRTTAGAIVSNGPVLCARIS